MVLYFSSTFAYVTRPSLPFPYIEDLSSTSKATTNHITPRHVHDFTADNREMTTCFLLTLCLSLYDSIIKRLDQYDEFFPAFQTLVSELKRILSECLIDICWLTCCPVLKGHVLLFSENSKPLWYILWPTLDASWVIHINNFFFRLILKSRTSHLILETFLDVFVVISVVKLRPHPAHFH